MVSSPTKTEAKVAIGKGRFSRQQLPMLMNMIAEQVRVSL
jgi:hypothetical protein